MSAPASPAVAPRVAAASARPAIAPPPARAREAALLLHALAQADREWLLARLSEADRAVLRPLVSELETLGIPADRALVDEIVAPARAVPAEPVPPLSPASAAPADAPDRTSERADPQEILDRADPVLVAEVLRDEPPGLVARLLAVRTWRWRDALPRRLGATELLRVEDLIADRRSPGAAVPSASAPSGVGTALRERLVARVLERLRVLEEERRTGPAPGAPRRGATAGAPRASFVDRLLGRGRER